MFCINCGTKLPDGAKFCFNCGARMPEMPNGTVPEGAPAADKEEGVPAGSTASPEAPATSGQPGAETAPAPVEETLPDVPGSQCVILPNITSISPGLWPAAAAVGPLQPGRGPAETACGPVYPGTRCGGGIHGPGFAGGGPDRIIFNACDPSIEAAVEVLLNHGIDFISKKIWKTDFFEQYKKTELVTGLAEDQEAISRYLEQLGEEKEMNKAHWQGGGLRHHRAITGAVKAACSTWLPTD